MNEVKITWEGHSCFRMEYRDFSLVVDPYDSAMMGPGTPPLALEADAVYCSHGHGDHNFTGAVTLTGGAAPEDFSVAEAVCPHDDAGGSKRGMNTVRRFDFGGVRVAHMGDVGCVPGGEVFSLIEGCDVLMIPVGGFYTVDAATAWEIVRQARPRCVVPMHYRHEKGGFDVLSTVEDFAQYFTRVRRVGRELTLSEPLPEGLVIMQM